jgi:hypothetical protein
MLNHAVSSTVTNVSRKKRAVVPSQTTVQHGGKDETQKCELKYSCDECDQKYVQPQGVKRHQREKHGEKSFCPNCNDFRWNRPYQLKKHLKEKHPEIDLEATLGNVTKCRREASMNKKHSWQQQASPTIECDRSGHGEPPRSPSASFSTEERPQPVNDAAMSFLHGQIRLAYPFGWYMTPV